MLVSQYFMSHTDPPRLRQGYYNKTCDGIYPPHIEPAMVNKLLWAHSALPHYTCTLCQGMKEQLREDQVLGNWLTREENRALVVS